MASTLGLLFFAVSAVSGDVGLMMLSGWIATPVGPYGLLCMPVLVGFSIAFLVFAIHEDYFFAPSPDLQESP